MTIKLHLTLIATLAYLSLALGGCPTAEPDDDDDNDDASADDDTGDDDTGDDDTGDDDTGDDDTGDDDTGDDDTSPVDADGDGWDESVDCDDNDPALNHDDADGDGVSTCDGDCDDGNSTVYPDGPEQCDGLDNDCDEEIDEDTGDDGDGDGYNACNGDCNDQDAWVYPGAPELCDGVDNDCDGEVDEDTGEDNDGDGYNACAGDCDDGNDDTFPGASEICDGLDNDCDGSVPGDESDADGDGWSACDGDCDDSNGNVHPGADEIGNGLDDDCNGVVDDLGLPCNYPEVESNDDYSLADGMLPPATRCGTIDPAGDEDWYGFTAGAWSLVTFDIDAESENSLLWSEIAIYADDGTTLLGTADDDGAGGEDAETAMIFPSGGTYYVEVTDESPFYGGPDYFYSLTVTATQACDTVEVESNDDYYYADPVTLAGVACGHVDSWLDDDWFSFFAAAGETWTFDMDAYENGSTLNAQLALYDTDGFTLLELDEPYWPYDPLFSYTFAYDGYYYLEAGSDLILIDDYGPYLIYIY